MSECEVNQSSSLCSRRVYRATMTNTVITSDYLTKHLIYFKNFKTFLSVFYTNPGNKPSRNGYSINILLTQFIPRLWRIGSRRIWSEMRNLWREMANFECRRRNNTYCTD